MPLSRLLRLGLRQFAAGMLSVLALGILNRVMKVELGVELGAVGLIIGAHYFAAPLAIGAGHRSDHRPYLGLHRTPYIIGGAVLTSISTALTPFVAFYVSDQGGSPLSVAAGIAVFLIMGAGIFTAGTAYLSLLADLTENHERGRAVAIVWAMLMTGILAGVALSAVVLDQYSRARLSALFVGMSVLVLVLTVVAVWGQERRVAPRPSEATLSLRQAVALLTGERQTALFFVFVFGGILFLFIQQVVLEPFGGDVFGMSVRQTTLFNAYQMVGVLAGMAAGTWLSRRLGARSTAGVGLAVSAAAFACLAFSAAREQPSLVRPAVLLMGVGMGMFNVGGLSLMMSMSRAGRVGLYMGAWTVSQALANGVATAGGGLLYEQALTLVGATPGAYAVVFAIEAAGLALLIALVPLIDVAAFGRDGTGPRDSEHEITSAEREAVGANDRE